MANHQHTYVTRSELRREEKKKKRNKSLKILGIVVAVFALRFFGITKFVSGLYNHGEIVERELLTADDLRGDTMHILVCGIDWNEDRSSENTDVIMYVTLDLKNNKASAFQIPRDTYIGDDVKTAGSGKINGVYGKNGSANPIMDLAKCLNKKLSLPVDHYVTLDMEAFINIVNSVDNGLDMYVPCPIILKDGETGKTEKIIEEPGWYKVNGELAEQIVRNRNYLGSDIQRLEVQRYFYAAVIKYFMENTDLNDFILLMSRFTQYLTTDMDWREIASIAKFGFGVKYEDMVMVKPSVHGYNVIRDGSSSVLNVVVPVQSEWIDLINEYCLIYEDKLTRDKCGIPSAPPKGQIVDDYGATAESITSIGALLSAAK